MFTEVSEYLASNLIKIDHNASYGPCLLEKVFVLHLSMIIFDQMFFSAAFFNHLITFQKVIKNAFARDL